MTFLAKMKQSFGNTFSFVTDSWSELKKVKWPSRKEMISYTLVVVVTVVIMTLYFWVIDLGISGLLRALFE